MKKLKLIKLDEEGSTLLYTIMVFTVLMIFVTFLITFTSSENKMSLHHQRKIQAYYVARSGAVAVERAIIGMNQQELIKLKSAIDKDHKVIDVNIEDLNFDPDKKLIEIKIRKDNSENLEIVSKGEVYEVQEEVTKVLTQKTESIKSDIEKAKLDMPMYVYNNLSMNSNKAPDVEGNIILVSKKAKFSPKEPIGVEVRMEARHYPTIYKEYIENLKDKFIKENKVGNATQSTNITKSLYIKDNTVTFKGVTVNATSEPIDILVNNLTLEGDSLNIKGEQKVRLFVENKLVFKGNNLFVNKGGKSNQLEIYHYGSDDTEITDPNSNGNTFINANIYIESAKVLVSKVKMEGMIYAPESDIIFDNTANSSTYIYGVIGDTVSIAYHPGPRINKPKMGAEIPTDELVKRPEGDSNNGTETTNDTKDKLYYERGYFK